MNAVAEITTYDVMRYDAVKNNFNADKKSVAVEIVFNLLLNGKAFRKIFLGDKALIFSGRCSGEMIIKVMNMKIPIVVAKSVPTTYSISLTKKFGITLVGRLTADSFCIYTNSERIVLSEEG